MGNKLWQPPPASAVESRLLDAQRPLGAPALEPLDPKTRCLAAAALTIAAGGDEAALYGLAARRAGASWAEINGIATLVERVAGLRGGSKASTFSSAVHALERQARLDGAFAANA